MTYASPAALRAALERQLRDRSAASGVGLDRLRRRVVVERVMSRLQAAEPGRWVLKGGMALEVRLHDDARLTKDVDLGLRAAVDEAGHLRDRLVEALTDDPYGDGFVLVAGPVAPLVADRAGFVTWRSRVAAELAGKAFGAVQLDISPRAHELDRTDALPLPNSLAFAGIEAPTIEVVDVHRHAAEKLHAMLRRFDDRENSRVRDLVDLVLLSEHGLLEPGAVATAARRVWRERDGADPPGTIPALPAGWVDRYERAAAELGLGAASFPAAVGVVRALWDGTVAPTVD